MANDQVRSEVFRAIEKELKRWAQHCKEIGVLPIETILGDDNSLQHALTDAAIEAACSQPVAPGPDGECFICKKPTSSLHGNPSLWPLWLEYVDGNGQRRCYHYGCVIKALAAPPQVSAPRQIAQHAQFEQQVVDEIRTRAEEGHPIHWSDLLYVLHGLKAGAVSAPRCPVFYPDSNCRNCKGTGWQYRTPDEFREPCHCLDTTQLALQPEAQPSPEGQ